MGGRPIKAFLRRRGCGNSTHQRHPTDHVQSYPALLSIPKLYVVRVAVTSSGYDQPIKQSSNTRAAAMSLEIDIRKEFRAKGSMQLFLLTSSTEFICGRCQSFKMSRLVAIQHGDWERLICNGCYGELLSAQSYETKVASSNDPGLVETCPAHLSSVAWMAHPALQSWPLHSP